MASARWSDLLPRVLSAIVLVAVCVTLIWLGGIWMRLLAAGVVGAGIWELARMLSRGEARRSELLALAFLCAAVVAVTGLIPGMIAVPILLAPAVVGAGLLRRDQALFAVAAVALLVAGSGFVAMRLTAGLWLIGWFVAVVVITDIAGYFGGRLIGGPKFWPQVSPKKTWAGILCGWVGAALVGVVLAPRLGLGVDLAVFSVLVSLASQMGDIGESAIKRHVGVKDSSTLIPGHGGVLDRFDGMIGGALFVMASMAVAGYPAGL